MTTNIWSEQELLKFYNEVICFDGNNRPLHACDFFCVAARKKYMTEEQKQLINLGDTCMMQKTLLKEADSLHFVNEVKKVNATLDYLVDRDNNLLPRSCMAFYININHVDMFKAVRQFKHLLTDWDYDISSLFEYCSISKKDNISRQLKTIQNNLLKSFQDPKNSMKGWIDIDCDIDEDVSYLEKSLQIDRPQLLKSILQKEINSSIPPYVIKTRGGIHVLVNTQSFREHNSALAKEFSGKELGEKVIDIQSVLTIIKDFFKDAQTKEIKINQNASVPLPGTIQGGFKVRIY